MRELADLRKQGVGVVMIRHHVRDRSPDRSKECLRYWIAGQSGLFHPGNIGEQHLLLFEHVRRQFLSDRRKEWFNLIDLRVQRSVLCGDFGQQRRDSRGLSSHECVMRFDNVSDEITQRFVAPLSNFRSLRIAACCRQELQHAIHINIGV